MTWLAVAAWLALTFIGPPVRIVAGSGGRNTPLGVTLPPDSALEASGQSPAGVKAQEVGEWRLAKLCGLFLAGAVAATVDGAIGIVAALIAAVAGEAIARKASGQFDFVGHNIEIIVAQREGRTGYRMAEIARMQAGDQVGMTIDQIDDALRKWEWLAWIMVKLV